jgi:hypothetical protein
LDELDPGLGEFPGLGGIAHERTHMVAMSHEMASEMPAGESGRSGDEDLHRSASMVTGEPASRRAPAAASPPSRRSVKAREPIRL